MQQNDLLIHCREQCSCGAVAEPRADFPEAITQMIHEWFAQRLGKLDLQDVYADGLALFPRQSLQPLPHGLMASAGREKKPHASDLHLSAANEGVSIRNDTYVKAEDVLILLLLVIVILILLEGFGASGEV